MTIFSAGFVYNSQMAKNNFIVYISTAPNGKSYIGQTITTLQKRRQGHLHDARNGRGGKPECRAFNAALRKYGSASFQWKVLCRANNMEELNAREEEYIARYNTLSPNGYNLTTGGGNAIPSDETRERIGAAHRGKKPGAKACKNMSEAAKRRWANPAEHKKCAAMTKAAMANSEVRKKQKAGLKRRWANPAEHEKAAAAAKRRYEDPAEREKSRQRNKQVWANPELREKQSATQKMVWANLELREKLSAIQKRRFAENPVSDETRKKTSETMKERWTDPEYREKHAVAMANPETKAKHAAAMANPERSAKISAAKKRYWAAWRERNNPSLDV